MKIANVQMQMNYTAEENLRSILRYISQAASKGAELIAFPELAVTGCHREIRKACDYVRSKPDWIDLISRECQKHQVTVFVGAPTFTEQGIHDSYILIGPDGKVVGESRKNGLTESETTFFTPGVTRNVWTISGLNFGVVFCREIADLSELLKDLGRSVDVLLWPCFSSVHESLPTDIEQMSYEQAKLVAGEFGAHLIQSNWANSLNSPEIANTGGSIFMSNLGEQVAASPLGKAGFGIADTVSQSFEWHGI